MQPTINATEMIWDKQLIYFKWKIPINSRFKQIFFQHAIQYSELMAMSQTYVISSDFGHDIFHGSVDQLIQWTSCLDCLINITLCYMLCYIGPMGPNLPISEIKPFNLNLNPTIKNLCSFGQNRANARLYLDISPKNRCHKPYWQGFGPPPKWAMPKWTAKFFDWG